MLRNMEKTAEKATKNIPDYYDINCSEINELMKKARHGSVDEAFTAIITAFKYGFVLGHRATVAEKMARRL